MSPDEHILRTVPNTADYFKETMGHWTVTPYAFKPHAERDPDGLSLFREDFVTPQEVATTCKHPASARVVRLKVSDLIALGLSVESNPQPEELPGHVIIPEMNYGAAKAKQTKRRIDDLTQKLAALASKSIAYSPSGLTWPKRS